MASKPGITARNTTEPCGQSGQSYVFLEDNIAGRSRHYKNPLKTITASSPADVGAAMDAVDAAIASGHHVAGYASYELGLCLDTRLKTLLKDRAPNAAPLLCFGVFDGYCDKTRPAHTTRALLPRLYPQWSEQNYTVRFAKLLDYIQAGDIYQANLTFPYQGYGKVAPDLPYLLSALRGRQPVRYSGIIRLCAPDILSLSPELFFKIEDGQISARPMKGTAPRGGDPKEDVAIGAAMLADEKSRAENLMIVDLLRNDMSRISETGSVTVTDLFTLESYPTLHQMTSGITAALKPNTLPSDIFKALFPCGSVTGAPKIRAMEIIAELEDTPRGPYCGAMGYFDPNGDSAFNVAIRTLISSPSPLGGVELAYHVGSGVVYDSDSASEYEECQLKAQILETASEPSSPPLGLIETLLWTPQGGFAYLEGHMIRLMKSASDLNFQTGLDLAAIMGALDDAVAGSSNPLRVRLRVEIDGTPSVTQSRLAATPQPLKLRISKNRIIKNNILMRYKISPCLAYDDERRRLKDIQACDELIVLNEHNEVCEGSYTNIFVQIDGQLYTPPLSCGLLPGVLRAHLLQTGKVKTRVLTTIDLTHAEAIYMGNSVRGLCKARLNTLEEV